MRQAAILAVLCCGWIALPLQGQVTKIVFGGSGANVAWSDGSVTGVASGGFALNIPIRGTEKKAFARPFAVTGIMAPPAPQKPFPLLQGGCMAGYQLAHRVAAISGFAETVQFRPTGDLYLPTGIVAASFRIRGRWGMLVPATFNARGWGTTLQVAYKW